MTHEFIKLLLAFALFSTLPACSDKGDNSSPTSSPRETQAPTAPVAEEPKDEVIDLSWVPKESVSCRKKGCLPSVPLVFTRPTPDATERSLSVCMGVLVDENTVVASGNCLPTDVAEGKVSCKSRVFLKFPSIDSVLPEQGVGCDSIEKFSIIDREKEEDHYSLRPTPPEEEKKKTFRPSYMVIKLAESVHRIKHSFKNSNFFRHGGQYLVAKFEAERGDRWKREIDYKLSSQLCPTIENKATAEGKAKNVVALDCDLSMSIGAPIFYQPFRSGLSLTGIVHSQAMTSSSSFDQLGSLMGHTTYRLYLGFSHKCIDEIDCSGIDLESSLKADSVEDQSKTEASATEAMEEWIEKSPLSRVIQWEIVDDLAEHEAKDFWLFEYPTLLKDGDYGTIFSLSGPSKYKDYKMSAPVPKCVKTAERARWIEAYLALDTLTDSQRSVLESDLSEGMIDGDTSRLKGEFEFNVATWSRKEHESFGVSNYIGERKFKIEVRRYRQDIKWNRVSMSSIKYVVGADDSVGYSLTLPLCETE